MTSTDCRGEFAQRKRAQERRCVCALFCFFVLASTSVRAQSAPSPLTDETASHNAAKPICRSGAFFDAIVLMNSTMRAYGALTANDQQARNASNVAAAELGAIMAIALKQANAEYQCVEGNLPLTYAKNYGDTLRAAIEMGKKMRVNATTLDASGSVLARLDAVALESAKKR